MAFKMTPFHLAQPDKVQGGNYRNPATIIDRSAEILGAGIQSGVNNFITTYAEAKKDEVKKEKPKEKPKEEPKINEEAIEEELKTNSSDNAFEDVSVKLNKFKDFKPGEIEVVQPDSAFAMQVGKGSPNQLDFRSMSDADLRAKYDQMSGRGGFFRPIAGIYEKEIKRRQSLGDFGMETAVGAAPAEAGTVAAQAPIDTTGTAPAASGTNPFEGQTFTITPAQMKANLGVFGEKESRDRSVKR